MSDGDTELLRAEYSPAKHSFTVDGKEVALQPDDEPALHAFVDGSVIELIVSERIGCTKRFYYTASAAPDVLVHVTGGATLNAWKISPISPNRLTTPAQSA
jgi:beta-fructofuranosidase